MHIYKITDKLFARYGRRLEHYDVGAMLAWIQDHTPCPRERVIYEASVPELNVLSVSQLMRDELYGGMPIQVGYCNGYNHSLNCLEYHRGCEIDISVTGYILLLADLREMNGKHQIHTENVAAFEVPAGMGVLLYETTLHYAPCVLPGHIGFQGAVVLPEGTNGALPVRHYIEEENRLLFGKNKWLLAHPEAPEAKEGAYVGLTGPNLILEQEDLL